MKSIEEFYDGMIYASETGGGEGVSRSGESMGERAAGTWAEPVHTGSGEGYSPQGGRL